MPVLISQRFLCFFSGLPPGEDTAAQGDFVNFAGTCTAGDALTLTTLSYNSDGYLTQIQGPLSGDQDVTNFTFYGYGLVNTVTDSEGYTLTYSYDPLNRLTAITYPDGTSEQTIYNKLDAVMHSDRLGRCTRNSFDSLDQLISQTDPLGRTTHYCWCSCGSLASLTDPAHNTTTWHHDLEGRITREIYPDQSTTSFAYEPTTSLLRSRTDALNQVTTYSYNIDNTLQSTSYSADSTSTAALKYDSLFGKLTSISNGWGQYSYSYNPLPPVSSSQIGEVVCFWSAGNPQEGDQIGMTFTSSALPGGTYTMPTYTVTSIEVGNPEQLAVDLANTLQDDETLANANIQAGSLGWGTLFGTMLQISGDAPLAVTATTTGGTILAIAGGARLSSVSNNVIPNSTITYLYDALERTTNHSINGSANSITWSYDAMSRITAEQNVLGTFNYSYIDDTPGSSKGTLRLASIAYPNSQTTNFSYLPNIGDQRLQQISNLGPGSSPPTLSQFNYAYSQAGEITQWLQNVNGTTTHLSLGYDKASQLTSAPSDSGSTFNAYISGTPHVGDVISVTAYDASLTGTTPPGQETASYTVQSGDTSAVIASNLATNISSAMSNISVTASAASNAVVTINTSASYATSFTAAVTGTGATDTISLSRSSATQPLHNQIYYHYDQAANRDSVQGNSTGSFPGGLTTNVTQSQYNCVNALTSAGPGGAVKFLGTTVNPIKSAVVNISQAATVGGTGITAGDVVTLSVHDAGLNQAENVSYTVGSADTFTSIAAALASGINTDAILQGIGVSATATGAVVTISSSSTNATTYTTAASTGASESITLGGSLGKTARLNWSESFSGNPVLATGSNTAAVTAVSGGGTPATNTYPITVSSGTTQTFTNDADGNMTGDGTNNYSWDAENRVLTVTYPGANNYSQFTYDGLGNRVKIVETRGGMVTDTKQFVYCGNRICEERDASGNVTRQFFSWGENIGGTNYYYFKDHNGTIWGMCDASGTIVALYTFDPYGVKTTIIETVAPTFQYAGMYFHGPSGLYLTKYRAYSASLGRWLSRDPLEEVLAQINIPDLTGTRMPRTLVGSVSTTAAPASLAALRVPGIVQSGASSGINLYEYALNNPLSFIDPLGLQSVAGTVEYIGPLNTPYYDYLGVGYGQAVQSADPLMLAGAMGSSTDAQMFAAIPTLGSGLLMENLGFPAWNAVPSWAFGVGATFAAGAAGTALNNWLNSQTPAGRSCPTK